MIEFINENFWPLWIAAAAICAVVLCILNTHYNAKHWHITVDGETFELVMNLDIDRRHHEVYFWDVLESRWQHLVYSRMEIYALRAVKE